MDGYTLNITNTSDTNQSFELFNSSDGNSFTERQITYSWSVEFATEEYYSTAEGKFVPGQYQWVYGGLIDPAIGELAVSVNVGPGGATPEELTELFNENEPGIVGEWTFEVTSEPPSEGPPTAVPITTSFIRIFCKIKVAWGKEYINTELFSFGSKYFRIIIGGMPDLYLTPGATEVLFSAFGQGVNGNPNIVVGGLNNFSYDQFLNSVVQRTYEIKEFDIFSTNQNQLLEPLLFDRKLATGRVYQKVLTPTIDPYQSQNVLVTKDKKGYQIDGFTSLKYKLLPYSDVRIVMRYNYIDIATSLIVTEVKEDKDTQSFSQSLPVPTSQVLSQYIATSPGVYGSAPLPVAFTDNMTDGYNRFGCKFLKARLVIHEDKLEFLKNKPAGKRNPKWQQFLKDKIQHINDKLNTENCIIEEEIPQFSQTGILYQPRNLFIPTNEFIQHQIDQEVGVKKLLEDPDFPIDLGQN